MASEDVSTTSRRAERPARARDVRSARPRGALPAPISRILRGVPGPMRSNSRATNLAAYRDRRACSRTAPGARPAARIFARLRRSTLLGNGSRRYASPCPSTLRAWISSSPAAQRTSVTRPGHSPRSTRHGSRLSSSRRASSASTSVPCGNADPGPPWPSAKHQRVSPAASRAARASLAPSNTITFRLLKR